MDRSQVVQINADFLATRGLIKNPQRQIVDLVVICLSKALKG
jgi:hypothetical protein